MILGVDFDNTLVCYDGLFYAAGRAAGLLPPEAPRDKTGVRSWLISRGRERDFTILQGEVYGHAIRGAKPYPDALECLRELKKQGNSIFVVSHKTRLPVLGPEYNLHTAAREWLQANRFFADGMLAEEDVFFETTMKDKAQRAAALGCTHFVDDMARFLLHPSFPARTEKIWFRPAGEDDPEPEAESGLTAYASWGEVARRLRADGAASCRSAGKAWHKP